ncbi:2Fe-2S iron-sulfur cluster-binding protein [Cognatazoarcus halotolerans]|uniref:2Fe-2S iron-sulfur cluster-binding protein n=1 Tax=Cognatazoarcus halotolerans TaxID=2686016 RepID=UPI00135B5380|nr:2Fe-2S iron-sulfur cluster-binding protein [Cognatazoarcus halotolerans]MBX3680789.1 2Fe-2S iron-sulfur cluster binding domain-containing protein [Rhodocyclaceae bacterium]MCB1898126.1 2Fe-2S iron-sulfur cluster binding domain-containing protein [Rhodocyclaceae bacterium]MCP5311520.1 2Fe-2S iron-sulfur cluster binding domain-containing protein [Zoogloeaceae bacterium]
MPQHRITIVHTGEEFGCDEEDNVLHAASDQLRRKDIPIGCCNGGCGVCKVRVTAGRYVTRKMSRAVCGQEEEASGCVLACKLYPRSDLTIEVVGKMVRAIVARRSTAFSFDFRATVQVVNPDKET